MTLSPPTRHRKPLASQKTIWCPSVHSLSPTQPSSWRVRDRRMGRSVGGEGE